MLRNITWHPFLLALYPALHLLSQNTASVRPRAAYLSLLLSAAVVLVLWALFSLVLKSRGKAAILATLTAVLFFSHGHLLKVVGGEPRTAWILIGGGSFFILASGILLARWHGNPQPWNRILDVAAAALTVIVLVPIVSSEMKPATNLPTAEQPSDEQHAALQTPLGYLPDIYIIVMDAFGRSDKLREIYDVDLSELQEHLEQKDFVIAERANANYCQTSLSLASFFNSQYLPELLPDFGPGYSNKSALNNLVHKNRAVRRLRNMGYQLVTLAGGSELAVQARPDVIYRRGALNEFQTTLLATTPLGLIQALFTNETTGNLNAFTQHREGVRYQLAKLPHVMADEGPKLVFAHVLSPHPPFVFGPHGEELTPDYEYTLLERRAWDGYVPGYTGQVTWVAKELQKTVDGILAASRRPPVILIMGDHGPASRWIDYWHETDSFDTTDAAIISERIAIFLALLLPPGAGGEVYPELTPINLFPLIFERCFGEPAALQADHSYFSTYENWSNFWNTDHITQ